MKREIDFKGRRIGQHASILEAMKLMDQIDHKLLIITTGDSFLGLISAGDIQRAIIGDKSLDTPVGEILRDNIRVADPKDSFSDIKSLMLKYRMELCPVLDEQKNIVAIYFWEDIFEEPKPHSQSTFNLPVIIMAGGKGTRLKPITNIIPKPLVPLGEKPIVEWIIDSFYKVGVQDFYFTVNYKKEMIEEYFNNIQRDYKTNFFIEDKPLGTAGSLHLLKNIITTSFFVTNCDILINDDYIEMLKYHRENANELTAICAVKHFEVPYGTMEFKENGILTALKEKPNFNMFINAGMYILEPHLLDEIPENEFFHITTLMEKIIERKGKVGVFPVSEGSWMDVGQWDEYNKTSRRLGFEELKI